MLETNAMEIPSFMKDVVVPVISSAAGVLIALWQAREKDRQRFQKIETDFALYKQAAESAVELAKHTQQFQNTEFSRRIIELEKRTAELEKQIADLEATAPTTRRDVDRLETALDAYIREQDDSWDKTQTLLKTIETQLRSRSTRE